jgi:hypothetical protein
MYRVLFAAALAALIAAPLATYAQTPASQPAASAAQAKPNKFLAGRAAARERQKKRAAEWKEAKRPARSRRG